MTKNELIEYLYDNHVTGDCSIEDMADYISSQMQKSAKWLRNEDWKYDFKCSECGSFQWDNTDYCPECGSYMLEGVNE